MNTDILYRAMCDAEPVPEEIFAKAKWMGDAADAASSLHRRYLKAEKALIAKIQAEGMYSEEYQVKALYRPYAKVNLTLLREREADLYADIVHVRPSDAARVLTPKRLYSLMAEELGDAITNYEVVTVTDLRRTLPAAEAERYILDDEEFVKLAVVENE